MATESIEHFNITGQAEPLVLAVDNGGTNTRLELRSGDNVLGDEDYKTPQDYDIAVYRLGDAARRLASGQKIQAVGFAVAGEVDQTRIVKAGKLSSWVDRSFGVDVADSIGVEAESIVLMNDCVAAAKAQQVANLKARIIAPGYISTISTGFGGTGFTKTNFIPDEPGHKFLKDGAICECGSHGCCEAHISGSGILNKYHFKAEELPLYVWPEVVADTVETYVRLLNRLKTEKGFSPSMLYFFGSVATKSPHLILPGLRNGLRARRKEITFVPNIALATHGDNSGLVGAGDAAHEHALRA